MLQKYQFFNDEIKDDFRIYLESNEKGKTTFQNLCDARKVLRGKFIVIHDKTAPKTGQTAVHTIPSNPTHKSQIWKSQPH